VHADKDSNVDYKFGKKEKYYRNVNRIRSSNIPFIDKNYSEISLNKNNF